MRSDVAVVVACLSLAAGCATEAAPDPMPVVSTDDAGIARSAIYEVFVRDFSPEGNLRGVIDGLDRIEAVGADVVWLMPVQPNGVENRKGPLGSSYSVRDYRAIHPDYGTAEDFRALVDAAHARGMKVILDWVANHTAWDHVWVTEHPDFYTRDAQGRMSVPRDNEGKLTDWTDVAELDYGNPALHRAMIADMRWWLDEFGIDGFRMDVAGMVPDEFWRTAVPELRAAGATLLLAEWGDPKMYDLGFDLTYAWDTYHRLKAVWKGEEPASAFIEKEVEGLSTLPAGAMRMRFTTNHDETAWDDPPVTLFGGAAGARAAFVAAALLPGPRLVYNGQEVESPQKLGLFVRDPIVWEQPGAGEARAFYRRVLDLARTHEAFAGGDLEPVQTDAGDDVIAYRRGSVVVLVNARPRPVNVVVSGLAMDGARDLLSGTVQQGDTVALLAHGAVVLEPVR